MKKISLLTPLLFIFLLLLSGCLKDKGFEDQQYGINISELKAVSFPQASSSPIMGSINSQTTASTVQGPYITLEQSSKATAPVTATLQENNDLVTAEGFTILPAGTYTISTTSPVIATGENFSDKVIITIPNSTLLDPTKIYGVGLIISAVDQGYTIASNSKSIVMAFSIKNKYDGVYKLKFRTVGWAAYGIADGVSATYTGFFHMITKGENSVTSYSTYRDDDLLPAFAGGIGSATGYTAFGAISPLFIFNNSTNILTDVQNTYDDDGRGRKLELNPAVTDSRFDPDTQTIYAAFIMKQNGRPSQFFYDTLTYVKAR